MTKLSGTGRRALWVGVGLVLAFALSACATPGKVGTETTFDASEAEPDDIFAALDRDGRVTLRGVLFEFDSDKLSESGKDACVRLAKVMTDNPTLRVAVVGHTDSTGKFKYNLGLSERRARSMANELLRNGVAKDRLAPVGVGPLDPVASDDTEEGRALNRRVDVVLIE
jgi:outer membrane protein OmpA-like peptidoglycan-associated protein